MEHSLEGNQIGAHGAFALATALNRMPKLRSITYGR